MSKTIYKDPNRFYVYAFLREDGTPYYIGKGQGNRAWDKSRRNSPPDDISRIVLLKETLTETEAFDEEKRLIVFFGRKDLGTGILRNMTDGGEGTSGYKHTQESRDKQSESKTGENNPMFGKTLSPETIAKRSAAQTGKKQSPETIAKRSGEKNHNFGKCPSEETKAKRITTRARNKEAKKIQESYV